MNRRIAKKILNHRGPRYWEKSQYEWDGKYELFRKRAYRKDSIEHPAGCYKQTMRLSRKMGNWCPCGATPTTQNWKDFFAGWEELEKVLAKKHLLKNARLSEEDLASLPKAVSDRWVQTQAYNQSRGSDSEYPFLEPLPLLWQCIVSDLEYYSDRWGYWRLELMRGYINLAKQLLENTAK